MRRISEGRGTVERPEASDKQREEIQKLEKDLCVLLDEHLVCPEFCAHIAAQGFCKLTEFVALFDSKADVRERAPRFFRYLPADPGHPTQKEAERMKTENSRFEYVWQDARTKLQELKSGHEKTEKALKMMLSDKYEQFLASEALRPILAWMHLPSNSELLRPIAKYFAEQRISPVNEVTLEAALDDVFCEPIREAIASRKTSKAADLPGPASNAPRGASAGRTSTGPTSPDVKKSPEEIVKAIFHHWDRDHSGKLELAEFVKLFVFLGMSEKDANDVFAAVDMDCDDGVDVEEFLEWLLFAGKSSFIVGNKKLLNVSKEAAKDVRKYGETEAMKPVAGVIPCSVVASTRAILKCNQCQQFFSQAGFESMHKAGDFLEHTVMLLPPPPDGWAEQSTHKEMALNAIDKHSRESDNMKNALEAQLKKQFNAYDLDGNGTISSEEMTEVLLTMAKYVGQKKTKAEARMEADSLFKKLDKNLDMCVQLSEFRDALVADAMDPNSVNYGPEQARRSSEVMTQGLKDALQEKRRRS